MAVGFGTWLATPKTTKAEAATAAAAAPTQKNPMFCSGMDEKDIPAAATANATKLFKQGMNLIYKDAGPAGLPTGYQVTAKQNHQGMVHALPEIWQC